MLRRRSCCPEPLLNKRIDANTFESTITINGKDLRTTTAAVSKDGKTFTLTRKGGRERQCHRRHGVLPAAVGLLVGIWFQRDGRAPEPASHASALLKAIAFDMPRSRSTRTKYEQLIASNTER